MTLRVLLAAPCIATLLMSCGSQRPGQPVPLSGSGGSVRVTGQYQPLGIDEVAGVSLKDGQLVVRGSTEEATLALPPFVDTSQVIRHWALVTEAHIDGQKVLNFTHDQSLDDFTIALPDTDAEIRYGVFANRGGGEVMVLTWGAAAQCFWGYILIGTGAAR